MSDDHSTQVMRPDHLSTGRTDYDASMRMAGLKPGEPIFVLRAQDELACKIVRMYAVECYAAGVDLATIEQALKQADKMEAWPDKKLPDGPSLTEGEVKQLEFELERRSYNLTQRPNDVSAFMGSMLWANHVFNKAVTQGVIAYGVAAASADKGSHEPTP